MKNPTESILTSRATLLNTQSILESCRALFESNKPLLKEAVLNADITTSGGVQQITTLQTLDYALPLRIAALELQEETQKAALISAVNAFIEAEISPRARKSQGEVSAKVREELKSHFPNPALLEHQVMQSSKVNRFSGIIPSITENPYEGAFRFAQTALDAWEKLAELEAQQA